jgi:hypothetical protein
MPSLIYHLTCTPSYVLFYNCWHPLACIYAYFVTYDLWSKPKRCIVPALQRLTCHVNDFISYATVCYFEGTTVRGVKVLPALPQPPACVALSDAH